MISGDVDFFDASCFTVDDYRVHCSFPCGGFVSVFPSLFREGILCKMGSGCPPQPHHKVSFWPGPSPFVIGPLGSLDLLPFSGLA